MNLSESVLTAIEQMQRYNYFTLTSEVLLAIGYVL